MEGAEAASCRPSRPGPSRSWAASRAPQPPPAQPQRRPRRAGSNRSRRPARAAPGQAYQPPPGQPPPPATRPHRLPPGYGYGYPPAPRVPDNGPAVAGFVLSLVAGGLLLLSAGFSSVVSIGCAVAGMVYSRKGKRKVAAGETPKHAGLAQAGWIIGIVSLVLSLLATRAGSWCSCWPSPTRSSATTSSGSSTTRRASGRRCRSPPPQCVFSPETVAILAGPMANPYVKQYLMTAGPTPLPPAVSQVMAEPMLYHRAPAFVEVYARVLGRLKEVFGTAGRGARVRELRHRRDGVGGGEPRAPRRAGAGGELRQVRRALGRAVRRVRRRARSTGRRSGGDRSTRQSSTRSSRRATGSSSCSPRSPRPPPASSTTSASSPRWPTVTAR